MAAVNDRSEPESAMPPGPYPHRLSRYLALLRIRQWIKNGFVLMPLLLTPGSLEAGSIARVLLALLCFCAVSSASYIVNDYADREADRAHPRKRFRPLAAGSLTVTEAALLMALLLVLGFAGASLLSSTLLLILGAYFLLNLSYSFALKHLAIVDIVIIAAGFVLRVGAGAVTINVRTSVWIIVCTGLLALFLALAKRRDDLVNALDAAHRPSLVGYNKAFIDASLIVVISATFVSYVIYTTDAQVMARLGSEQLYLTIPFVLAGILRYLQIVLVEERSGSPTTIVLRDRFTIVCVLGWLACLVVLIQL